jgi:ELWxxDGT repeat protein
MVREIAPGSRSAEVDALLAVGDTLFFQATDQMGGAELWKSDGTPEGTLRVEDIVPGEAGSGARPAIDAGGVLVFTADDGEHGLELWRSDGTAEGTFLLADVNPGPRPSSPGGLTIAGGVLFFHALSDASGVELWKVENPPNDLPSIDLGPAAQSSGLRFTLAGAFSDPDSDAWTASVNYGDGSGEVPLALNPDRTFSLSHRYDRAGQYPVTVTVRDADGGIASRTVALTVYAPPRIVSVLVNGGTAQRSMVRNIAVRFDRPVTLSPGAATLVRRKEHRSDPAGGAPVAVIITAVSNDRRSVTLSFTGPGVAHGSLVDGVYDLRLSAAAVQDDFGQALAGSTSFTFHRLFGDFSGNGDVSGLEQHLVFRAMGSGYVDYFDFDSDGDVDRLDWKESQQRLSKRYSYVTLGGLAGKGMPVLRPAQR